MIRRKDLADLPEFKAKKKVKGDAEGDAENRPVNPYENLERYTFCNIVLFLP